jgi:hypothetical protein
MSECYRLKSYDVSPPGGYPFQDAGGRKFPAQPLIEAQAQEVSAWRTRNGKPRASVKECLQDVDHYQCQRLGNMRTFCIACDGTAAAMALNQSSPIVAPPCNGCGAPV